LESVSNIKILLVDDREENLASMEIVLQKESYKFFKANSGKEALKILLKEEDFSIILLDVKMPIMDGYETAELIYQREKLKHIPIIFITAHDYEEAAIFKGYKAGAVDYIRKPINSQILRSKVAVFAELNKKNQLLKQQEEKLREINKDLLKLNQELEERVKHRTMELEELNYELKQLNISKDKFISVISHDLRNPFSALLGSSEMLIKNIEKLEKIKIKQFSRIIHRSSSNILRQLNELVEWAKNQREKVNFTPKDLLLYEGTNQALELLKENAKQKNIKITNKIDSRIFVKADPFMLRSIIQNLISNAIKFNKSGGSVTVSAEYENDVVEVAVNDTGIGIPVDARENLFDEFNSISKKINNGNVQFDSSKSGLGLVLVKDFISQHGGTISVDSTVGKGTTFRFTLPGFVSNAIKENKAEMV
jgi:two-component system, sensor histidine kinase and response regulator